MFTNHKLTHRLASLIVILSILLSGFQPNAASAQSGDGLKRQVNAESGKVSFIGPESGSTLPASKALDTLLRPQDPGLALMKRYAPEFGIKNPERDLSEMKKNESEDGRVSVRYQQNYQGIPVLGGELIVNTNQNGDLYSMNGEVSQDITIQTQPTIDSAQATQTALEALAKWYEKTPADFVASPPELWIFDESLLQSSTRPVELVWRMEVTALDNAAPVRELVLVNAERGNISLHFNQIDHAWGEAVASNPVQAPDAKALSSTNLEARDNPEVGKFTTTNMPAFAPVTYYVATTGNDGNACTSADSPCLTINGAIGKATSGNGDMIKVAIGTYTGTGNEVVLINKSITLSGGWNGSFTTQSGMSTIDGQGARLGVTLSGGAIGIMDHFKVQKGSACDAGGVRAWSGTWTLNNIIISNNTKTCSGGGGGINTNGNTTINNSTISNNIGGGIGNSSGTLTLNTSTINNNTNGSSGGGISNDSIVIVNNSTVISNTTTNNSGGGIYNSGTLTLNNSTISGNAATNGSGGGIRNEGTVITKNTIIALNTASAYPDCAGAAISSSGYNLIGNNLGCTFSATTGDLVGTNVAPINPRLTPLQDNGGSTFTHALMVGSPAIDAGNPATPGSGGNACLSTDQRGVARPVGTKCDIGAYEGSVAWVPSPLVNTYTANLTSSLPGTFLCNQTQPNCTNNSNPHADGAHKYAIGTYNFYATKFLRDSIDNNRMVIKSTVQYCSPYFACPYGNAFWSGTQMVYGSAYGFPLADDIVGHELTHGVTQYESNLFYYYQSGAINESLSDVFGEYYDQVGNVTAGDTAGVKWLLGEDVNGLGAIRSMSNPSTYGDPDKMSSPNYYEGADDSGGVHINSGVNNKAVYLMVDGGTFNAKTVTLLGWEKTGAIYYEANTNLLTSGSDYSDLYYALQQACKNLIGQKGITSGNCVEVKDAVDAVEMNSQPAPNFNTNVPLCNVNTPNLSFADDFEAGISHWSFDNGAYKRWQYDSPYGSYARSGTHFLYADDYPQSYSVTDASTTLAPTLVPYNAYLHFAHAYDFEQDASSYYDGGVLEYSTNGGASWNDAGSLIEYNGYRGIIDPDYINPLKGRAAFVGASHGYIDTRLNLGSLAGRTVSFRWRMGLDDGVSAWGWWVDNVKVYTCGAPTIFADVPNTYWAYQFTERLYNAGITGGCNLSPLNYCPETTVTRSQMAVFLLRGIHGASYNPPAVGASTGFGDVPTNYWAAAWIKQLAAEGITGGCGSGNYCPEYPVTRDQMAVFLLRSKYGSAYNPPAVGASTGFGDVPTNHWAAAWIKQLVAESITSGCGSGNYCPDTPVSRSQMAVFLVKTFNLP